LSIYVDAIDWMTAVYHNPNARNMWTFFINTLNDGIKLFVPSYKLCDTLVTRSIKPRCQGRVVGHVIVIVSATGFVALLFCVPV